MKLKMKLLMLFCCFFISACLTGCKTESMKSPEKLLEKPVTNEFNYKIYNDIRKLTPIDTTFILPKNATEVGRINKVDLNSDGSNEVIAFKKKINENQDMNSIYMYIFESEGDSIVDDSERMVRISGDNIKYANFVDINNDGTKEIVLQISNKGFENIYIYKYVDQTVKKMAEYSTSKYAIKLNFYDYNSSGKEEGLAILQDLTSFDAILSKVKIEGEEIVFDKFETSKNIDSLDKVDIINGKVSKNQRGSMVVYQNFDGSLVTQIVVYRDGKFVKAFSDDDGKLKNPSLVKPFDIDGDGILEIPKIEFKFSNNTPKESNIITWYEWNGQIGKESRLKTEKQIFYCYDYNFMISIPNSIEKQFFIKQKYGTSKSIFEFYSRKADESLERLFDIVVVQKNSEEVDTNGKTQNQEEAFSNVLSENEEYTYIYRPINKKYLEDYKINFEKVKEKFEIINK